ncbi:PREDICTED: NFATC2-interacting protein [Nanorana parkeri]|uniref:NFATC2-interacting protein n=1 Tax=Nanorana parkeri TaxID=125878 RepID=UPI000854D85A|nr:PREDICTED: NFATC2-interacting protein [Nanorana parkeri]
MPLPKTPLSDPTVVDVTRDVEEVPAEDPICSEVVQEDPNCLEMKTENPEPPDSARDGHPAALTPSTCVAASPGSHHRYDAAPPSRSVDKQRSALIAELRLLLSPAAAHVLRNHVSLQSRVPHPIGTRRVLSEGTTSPVMPRRQPAVEGAGLRAKRPMNGPDRRVTGRLGQSAWEDISPAWRWRRELRLALPKTPLSDPTVVDVTRDVEEVPAEDPICSEVVQEDPNCLEMKTENPEPPDSARDGHPAALTPSTCVAASPGSHHRYDASEDSSDSDVAVVLPQKPKRRRIFPRTAPILSTVYSNKVNSSLKLLPDNVSTVAAMEKELQKKQGCDDLGNEAIEPPLPVTVPAPQPVLSDTEDVDSQQPEVVHERIRNSSPSPPPSPNTPVLKGRKGALNSKIRKMEACLQDLGTVLSPKRSHLYEDNDVIMMEASTVPELIVKVRRRGKIFRINIRMTDPLQRLVDLVASHLDADPSQIMLLRGDEELNTKETAKSLNLTVADIIDCMVLSSSGGQEADDEHTEEKICLKIQGRDKQSQLTVTVGKNEPLKSLMDQYKSAMGLTKKVCFMFEGRKLNGRSTADQLGLESDDLIEAWT